MSAVWASSCLRTASPDLQALASQAGLEVGDETAKFRAASGRAGVGATEEAASGTTSTVALALAHAHAHAHAHAGLLTAQRPTLDMLMGVDMGRSSQLSVHLDFAAVRARLRGCSTRVLTGTIDVSP